MAETRKAAIAAAQEQTCSKGSDSQHNMQGCSWREPQLIGEIMLETANNSICKKSGEVSLMAIIARHKIGGDI